MNTDYADIRALTDAEPQWFDEQAVPRYAPFHPNLLADIYAQYAVLLEIACQGCDRQFHVAMSWNRLSGEHGFDVRRAIRDREIHFGDPPNVGCCMSGPTMNSVPRRVLQYWRRWDPKFTRPDPEHEGLFHVTDGAAYMDWARDTALEADVVPDWAKAGEETAS